MNRHGAASSEFSRLANSDLSMCGQRTTTAVCRIQAQAGHVKTGC